jgi:hypothetical protein
MPGGIYGGRSLFENAAEVRLLVVKTLSGWGLRWSDTVIPFRFCRSKSEAVTLGQLEADFTGRPLVTDEEEPLGA